MEGSTGLQAVTALTLRWTGKKTTRGLSEHRGGRCCQPGAGRSCGTLSNGKASAFYFKGTGAPGGLTWSSVVGFPFCSEASGRPDCYPESLSPCPHLQARKCSRREAPGAGQREHGFGERSRGRSRGISRAVWVHLGASAPPRLGPGSRAHAARSTECGTARGLGRPVGDQPNAPCPVRHRPLLSAPRIAPRLHRARAPAPGRGAPGLRGAAYGK